MVLSAILKGEYSDTLTHKSLTKHDKNLKLIVAIDDLDRCLPENVLEILEAIKLFVDLPNTFFLIAMDSEIIQHGLNLRYKETNFYAPWIKAKEYSEKMIDLSFSIPSVLEESFKTYVQNISSLSSKYMDSFGLLSIALKSNLRTWERYINKVEFNKSLIEALVGNSIFESTTNFNLFLKIQCLSYQWPELYRSIYNYQTYLELEKAILTTTINMDSEYELHTLNESLNIRNSIKNLINDKRMIDFLRYEPFIKDIDDKNILNIFFTIDIVQQSK